MSHFTIYVTSVYVQETENDTDEDGNKNKEEEKKAPLLELSFEYLMAKDKLQWISIFSDQAILLSVCLQSMVDELLLKKAGSDIKQVFQTLLLFQGKFYLKQLTNAGKFILSDFFYLVGHALIFILVFS